VVKSCSGRAPAGACNAGVPQGSMSVSVTRPPGLRDLVTRGFKWSLIGEGKGAKWTTVTR